MAKLYFNYGVMGSSKTANALMTRFNYEHIGKQALLVKPETDQRDGERVVKSRIGLSYPCIYFEELANMNLEILKKYDCIIIDEAQFLSWDDVDLLTNIVDIVGIPVVCYGLKSDFQGKLFPGSEALLALADKITEIKTVCWCGRKAIMNTRINQDGEVVRTGEQVELGADDKYVALCRKHWKLGIISKGQIYGNREEFNDTDENETQANIDCSEAQGDIDD